MGFIENVKAYCSMREAPQPLPEKVKIKVTTKGTGFLEKVTWGTVPEKIVKIAVVDAAIGALEKTKSATNFTWTSRAMKFDIEELQGLCEKGTEALRSLEELPPQERFLQLEQLYRAVDDLSMVGRTWKVAYEKVDLLKMDKLKGKGQEPVLNKEFLDFKRQIDVYKLKLEALDNLKSEVQSSLFELVSRIRSAVLERYVEKSLALLTELNSIQPSSDISRDLDRIEEAASRLNPELAVKTELATLFAPFQVEGEEQSIFGRLSALINMDGLQLIGSNPLQSFNEHMGEIKVRLSEMKHANAILNEIQSKRAEFQRFNTLMSKMVDTRRMYPHEESPAPVLTAYKECAEFITRLRVFQQEVKGEQPVVVEARNQLTLYHREWIEENNRLQMVLKWVLPRYVDFSEAVSFGLPLDFSGVNVRKKDDHFILKANGIYVDQTFYPAVQKYVCEDMESDTPWTLTKLETQKRTKDIGKGTVSANPFRKK